MASKRISFIGLGVMGLPMALNLAKSEQRLFVWSCFGDKCESLRDCGA